MGRTHGNQPKAKTLDLPTPSQQQDESSLGALFLLFLLLFIVSQLFKYMLLTTTSSSRSTTRVTVPAALHAFCPAAAAEGGAPSYCSLPLLHYPVLPPPWPSSSCRPPLLPLPSRVRWHFVSTRLVSGARARGPCAASRLSLRRRTRTRGKTRMAEEREANAVVLEDGARSLFYCWHCWYCWHCCS